MRKLGMLTTLVGGVVVAVAVAVAVRSVPDVKRYLKMRQM
jgi:hypothetical protein